MSVDIPPPDYNSVVIGQASQSTGAISPATGHAEHSDFQISVSDPVKQGENINAFVTYKLTTRTTVGHYKSSREPQVVVRRYSDFFWLHERLRQQYPGIIVPPVPEKDVAHKLGMKAGQDFVQNRARALQVFINRVAAHPDLKQSPDLQTFLEATETEWKHAVATANVETRSSKSSLQAVAQGFKDFGHSMKNLVSSRSDDAAEDPEYLKVKEYMSHLERHLSDVHYRAEVLTAKHHQQAQAWLEFADACEQLGKFESEVLGQAFTAFAEKLRALSAVTTEKANDLFIRFVSPLKEAVKMVRSVKQTMTDRSNALAHLNQAHALMESRRSHLAKLRGAPSKIDKLAEAERLLKEATEQHEQAAATYETIKRRMKDEIVRFQRERTAELAVVLRDFALIEAKLAAESTKLWNELLEQLQPLQQAALSNAAKVTGQPS